jgi:hypothetical protein
MNKNLKALRLAATLLPIAFPLCAEDLSPVELEFFESKVRPVLAENCYKCHATDAEKIRGGFLLDSKPGLLRGGDSGEAIIPGDAEASRLIHMIRHDPDFEAMPPKSKLSPQEIDDLTAWINRGAPDPRLEEPEGAALTSDFDLEQRKQWWSLQPVEKQNVPQVRDSDWPSTDYDSFILSQLEAKDWQPAEPADKRTLLRRLSFDLIGLAPTTEELEDFVSDPSKDAYAKQVDRLLASPHFGEKWARHWMDLVRYGETKSFEADYTMAYTWRYRDYLIKAFNEDLPYDQFVLESLAGDLLKKPRLDKDTGDNESIKGPGYIYLTDGQHGPPDLHADEARIFDGMIDTVSKAFLGTTVACARCHDHKFDAVTTADYYSMYGLLRSSRFAYRNTVSENLQNKTLSKLKSKKPGLVKLAYDASRKDAEKAGDYFVAAKNLIADGQLRDLHKTSQSAFRAEFKKANKDEREDLKVSYEKSLESTVRSHVAASAHKELDAKTLTNWVLLLLLPERQNQWPELQGLSSTDETTEPQEPTSDSFAAVAAKLEDWKLQGLAFEDKVTKPGTVIFSSKGDNPIQTILGEQSVAGHHSSRISGAIRSPEFIIDGKLIEFQAKGKFAAARLVIRNYELTGRGPTTDDLYIPINHDHWETYQMETYLWEGEPAYFEFFQHGEATHSVRPREDTPEFNDNAYLAFRFQEPDWNAFWTPKDIDEENITTLVSDLWNKGRRNKLNAMEADLLGAFYGAGLIRADLNNSKKFSNALENYRQLAQSIPEPRFVRSLADGDPKDEPVYIRGLHTNLSKEPNPRRWLDGLGGPVLESEGSGRLEWAEYVASPDNPLTHRVLVNRLWKHIFGKGIVETTNDFGVMGTPPSQPELLDYLANDFIRNDFSIKSMVRKMVLSSTYQMSSTPSEASLNEDPANKLLQHMSIKRLEAEAIRDHILACSGELDTTLFGPSAEAFVDDLPDSRAKPNPGPLDGDGRRSVYLEMRRGYLSSFLRAFDLPNATEPIGERQVTNVPAQSLALMNDPFVHEQATAWAKRLSDSGQSTTEKTQAIHRAAFSRPASSKEVDWAKRVLESLAAEYKTHIDDPQIWTDLCHLMYNRKDFIYLF